MRSIKDIDSGVGQYPSAAKLDTGYTQLADTTQYQMDSQTVNIHFFVCLKPF